MRESATTSSLTTMRSTRSGPRRVRGAGRALGAAGALLAATTLVLAGCGANNPESVVARPSTSTGAAPSPSAGGLEAQPQFGTDEFYKITMTITNNTNQTLWIKEADLGNTHSGAGWDDRPSNLLPGNTETVSAYAATEGQGIRLKFQSPTVDSAKATLMAQNPALGGNNYDGTSAAAPLQVKASITRGRQSSATYVLSGDA